MSRTPWLLPLLLALAWAPAQAARERPFIDLPSQTREDLDEPAPWAEGGMSLPDYPQDADLVEFQVDAPGSAFRYFIDTRSLAVGGDGVVRYTLVLQSASGARNVSHEGMRCDSKEYKVYAYGDSRGRFRPVPDPKWQAIRRSGPYLHHIDLQQFYFCPHDVRAEPYPVAEIQRRLGSARRDGPGIAGPLF